MSLLRTPMPKRWANLTVMGGNRSSVVSTYISVHVHKNDTGDGGGGGGRERETHTHIHTRARARAPSWVFRF